MILKTGKSRWAHQTAMRDFALLHPKALINGGVGVGKTLAALSVIEERDYPLTLVLTTKAAMRSVWEEDINEFFYDVDVLVLDKGTALMKTALMLAAVQAKEFNNLVVVVNYETAKMLPLDQVMWDYVIADESHKLKSHNSSVSVDLAVMLRNVPHKLAMTGTPWADRPTDVFGQVRFLDPRKNGKTWGTVPFGSWTSFFERYTKYREQDNIKIVTSYINTNELAEKLKPYVLTVDRDKVLTLPGIVHARRYAILSKSHRKSYDELDREMVVKIGDDTIISDNVLVQGLLLHQLAGGFYQASGGDPREIVDGRAKLDVLSDIVDELGAEPFVVFTRFQEDVNRIIGLLDGKDIESRFITGRADTHMEWRQGAAQALIANIQAGSAGINLTRAAYVIFYSTGFSNTDYEQALGRLDRPGQTRKVTAFHILAKGTIDEVIDRRLSQKNKEADKLEKRLQ